MGDGITHDLLFVYKHIYTNYMMAPASKQTSKSGKGCLIGCLGILVAAAVFFGGVEAFRRWVIVTKFDKDAFKKYELASDFIDIAEKITLTETAKDHFYKLEPRFVRVDDFIKFCKTVARGVEALACFAPKPYGGPFAGKTILLLQIDDSRFIDHKYSAAAHELLHSLYAQLSSEEKTRVNTILNQELAKHEGDTHLQNALKELRKVKKDEEDIMSELHSKFGVEYADIDPTLETYYQQYFQDRNTVVRLYFQGGFGSRVRRIDQLHGELTALSNQLSSESQVARYNAKVSEINALYAEMKEFYALFNPDYKPPEVRK